MKIRMWCQLEATKTIKMKSRLDTIFDVRKSLDLSEPFGGISTWLTVNNLRCITFEEFDQMFIVGVLFSISEEAPAI